MSNISFDKSYFKNSVRFLSDYFLHAQDKKKAWALFIASVLSILGITSLGFLLGWWCFPFISAAFMAKDTTLLLIGLSAGIAISALMAGCHYLSNYLKNELFLKWRTWLTNKVTNQYLTSSTNYLKISRSYKEIDNPEQRIQEDISNVISSFLDLSLGFIKNCSSLITYTVLLSLVGSSLSFALLGLNVLLPGYLVLMALVVGIGTSVLGYFINRSLHQATNEEIICQSDLRADLQQVKNSAEEIAIEHAEPYYQDRLKKKVTDLNRKTSNRLSIQNKTATFNDFNGTFQALIPFLAAAPLYFSDLISLEVFYSVGYYFSMITAALNWFVYSFKKINIFQTSLGRAMELQQILNTQQSSSYKIVRTLGQHDTPIEINNLDITVHNKQEVTPTIIKGLTLQFEPKVHTLIQAPSGTGKSSLLKAIAGTWDSGNGTIIIPKSVQSLYFLPQNPTLPRDSLRNVLAYPDAQCNYSDEELIFALKAVNMARFAEQLDQPVGVKSLGEQQRIAFARVLLRKPDWVFLDEATASLDEHTEAQMYRNLKRYLPNTTIISIAHRSTVKQYHDKILFFRLNDNKELTIDSKEVSVAPHAARLHSA